MDNESRFFIWIVGLIAAGITIISLSLIVVENWKIVKMAGEGYEEVVVPGRQDAVWQKAKTEPGRNRGIR